MSNHTHGPWIVVPEGPDGDDLKVQWSAVTDYCVGTIATVHPVPDELGSQEDNARLIKAAPDLLAACKKLVDEAKEDQENPSLTDAFVAARAAIAKAQGRETTT